MNGVQRRLHDYCATCGHPYGRSLATQVCTDQVPCAKRLEAPVARRVQIGRTLAVDPRWLHEHPEAG